jgi:predicted lipoprotein with Yx(FWY)xxD motif
MQGLRISGRLTFAVAVFAAVMILGSGVAGAATTATPAHAKLALRSSHFGKVIFAGNGKVIYMFGPDKTAKSTCYGECAKAWPPVLTSGAPVVGPGLNAKLLGTTTRRDGSKQVTYNRHPLYFFEEDTPDKIMCQHAVMHGGIWLVLKATGKPSLAKGTMM